jgi:hypothetical protein
MHKKYTTSAAILTLLALTSMAHAHPCTLQDLSWMAGSWANSATPERAQERWSLAPDGVLMGLAWEFPAGKNGFAEVMTVRADGASIAMFLRHFDGALSKAWEERDAPMVFTAANCERDSVVFDGQREHSGEHMSYRRTGDKLAIVADFLHHGTPDHEEWHMVRAKD